jgi:hypothetical protein
VNAAEFRKLALTLPESLEQEHMGHPDFRVRGKIFATLGPKEAWGMVKLTPAQQLVYVAKHANTFEPFAGAWGARGSTKVLLSAAEKTTVWRALVDAWRNVAPGSLSRMHRDL